MKKHFAPALLGALTLGAATLLAGCAYEAPSRSPSIGGIVSSSSEAAAVEAVATIESMSSSSVEEEMQEIVLTDLDYTGVSRYKGAEWLRAIGTKKITGSVTDGELVIELTRGDKQTSWSAAGMYIAPLAQGNGFSYPDESMYGTRLHFLGAVWRGDGQRHLSPESSFGVLKEHSATLTLPLDAVLVTSMNPKLTMQETIDIVSLINEGGVYLGFQPSDSPAAPYLKVTLRYRGTLQVEPF